jgi:UDP-glucuronate 4-epimerase
LAAQAGISYSLINPHVYIESNIVAFLNLLEGVRGSPVKHLVFASSSSIYGLNERMPYRPQDNVDHPISLYAASKKADELMAHAYAYLYGIPVTGLRFFTAYGPWDRPDMAVFRFCRAIFEGEAIKLFNYGKMSRDFTYVDDIVDGILRVLLKAPAPNRQWTGLEPDPASSPAGYRIYNIGAGRPLELQKLVGLIEKSLGKKAAVEFEPLRKFDMESTCADISDFKRDTGYQPQVMAEEGVPRMVEWFLDYYGKGRPWPKVKG